VNYDREHFNCAHFVAHWYREKLGIEIPVKDEFDRSFMVWMRRHFTRIRQPEDHCLVLMVNMDGSYHIGVWYDYGVWHNFKPSIGHGAVSKWILGSVKQYYWKVSFYKWSQ